MAIVCLSVCLFDMRSNENMQGFPESLAGLRGLGKGKEGERREEESWEKDREGVKEGKGMVKEWRLWSIFSQIY